MIRKYVSINECYNSVHGETMTINRYKFLKRNRLYVKSYTFFLVKICRSIQLRAVHFTICQIVFKKFMHDLETCEMMARSTLVSILVTLYNFYLFKVMSSKMDYWMQAVWLLTHGQMCHSPKTSSFYPSLVTLPPYL